jgi:hypothetical protein
MILGATFNAFCAEIVQKERSLYQGNGSQLLITLERFTELIDVQSEERDFTASIMAYSLLMHRASLRYLGYILGLLGFTLGVYLQQIAMFDIDTKSTDEVGFMSAVGPVIFALSLCPVVMSLMVGRCSMLHPLLSVGFWTAYSKLLPVFSLVSPAVCLWFLLSTSGQLTMDFNNQFYYFCGNLCFTLVAGLVIGGLSDAPLQSILRVPHTAS